VARERLSTVYFPGGKITMLPDHAVAAYTLAAGRVCPALSIYFDVAPDFSLLSHETRVERIRIADNLRHDTLEPVFNAEALSRGAIDHPQGAALAWLWQFSGHRLVVRKGDGPRGEDRPEFVFRVDDGRVSISRRQRGTPIDQVVAELMILANSTWAGELHEAGQCALFRVQSGGKVRTKPRWRDLGRDVGTPLAAVPRTRCQVGAHASGHATAGSGPACCRYPRKRYPNSLFISPHCRCCFRYHFRCRRSYCR
jgi:exoribonuclease R